AWFIPCASHCINISLLLPAMPKKTHPKNPHGRK
ncbi:MAG: hypothetical protein ACI957_004507, partial [Verrucomicrobiales bacterium]